MKVDRFKSEKVQQARRELQRNNLRATREAAIHQRRGGWDQIEREIDKSVDESQRLEQEQALDVEAELRLAQEHYQEITR